MVTEYGYQSLPSYSNLLKYFLEKDMFYNSSLNQHRQHHKNGNEEMVMEARFNLDFKESFISETDKFRSAIYLTQLNQAMGLKTATEFFVKNRDLVDANGQGKCMGAMYWQLNDVWTAPSWSTIEYGGQWKIGHYFMKESFKNLIAVGYETKDNFEIAVISHLNVPFNGTLVMKVFMFDQLDPPTLTRDYKFLLDGRSSTVLSIRKDELEKLSNCKFLDAKSCVINFQVFDNNKPCTPEHEGYETENFYLTNQNLAKVTNFKTPKLTIQNLTRIDDKNFEISIKTDQIGLFVWLELDIDSKKPNESTKNAEFYYKFNQNGFHMLKPTKTLKLEFSAVNNDLEPINRLTNSTENLRSRIRVTSFRNIYDSSSSPSALYFFNFYFFIISISLSVVNYF